MRILVVGGAGVMGTEVVRALKRVPHVEVAIGGRRGPVRVDLGDPETYPLLAGWDVVVNAADSLAAPPDGALAWVYDQGGTWVESSSEPEVIQRTLRLRSVRREGRVVLGAGVSTGLSNLVAARAASRLQQCVKLDLGVRFSPLSRAGAGMVDRMIHLAGTPASWWQDGELQHGPPLSPGPLMPVGDGGERALAWRAPSAEVDLLHASLGVPSLGVHLLPRPAWLGPVLAFTPPGLFRWTPTREFARLAVRSVRQVLLRRVVSPVTLVAVARGSDRAVCRLHLADGLAAGGQMIAALALRLAETLPDPGVHCVDEVTDLVTMLAGMAVLGGTAPQVDLQRDEVGLLSPG